MIELSKLKRTLSCLEYERYYRKDVLNRPEFASLTIDEMKAILRQNGHVSA